MRAADLNDLLRARVVAATTDSANAIITAEAADDAMKRIVTNELGASASAARQISSAYFSVAANATAAPTLTKVFSYANLLDVLRDLAEASRTAGTELYFDLVPTGETTFQFQTFTGQRGADRTTTLSRELVLSPAKNLVEASLELDARAAASFGYGLGQGLGAARTIQTAEDTEVTGLSVFGRRELAINAGAETAAGGVTQAAQHALSQARPRYTFSCVVANAPGSIYGVDWGYGDRLTVDFDGQQFTAMVRSVVVSVAGAGAETITPVMEAYL